MPVRIANVSVTLHRKKERLTFAPGDRVELTDKELDDLEALEPDAFRLPINESAPQGQQQPEAATPSYGKSNSTADAKGKGTDVVDEDGF